MKMRVWGKKKKSPPFLSCKENPERKQNAERSAVHIFVIVFNKTLGKIGNQLSQRIQHLHTKYTNIKHPIKHNITFPFTALLNTEDCK